MLLVTYFLMNFLAEYIFAAVLGLYMDEGAQCLPNSDEVLICTPETTSEEVSRPERHRYENGAGQSTKFVFKSLTP